ncbi:magnesium transporter [Pseudohalioglobus lutimaris]|uniref:Magnesium transporter n=2 Tax=Pseudohalioglobus lutimaris TaxID=1737061 RepID=A0A2N5X4W7_9GAMM|nr:magnesium transporter [Pseudohalioglobus lutimaris]
MDPVIAASLLARGTPAEIEDMLSQLPAATALKIASHLASDTNSQDAPPDSLATPDSADAIQSVGGTVADLMIEPFAVLSADTTVAMALDYVVKMHPVTTVTYIYVTGESGKLLGVVAMRDLLLARPGQTMEEIMEREAFVFTPAVKMPEAIAAALAKRHRLYPVVDDAGILVGLVYGWRLFEYVATELSGQAGSMVGVDREERVSTPIFKAFLMRHPWLQVNLLTAFAAAFVVGMFEDTITRIVALAAFLPVLAGQSGNTGCQALAITLRSMTLGELANISVGKLLRKEIILGALNGFFVGLIAALAMYLYASMSDAGDPIILAAVILIAMIGACIGSGIFGVLVPLTLRRFGADPAMASSIFLTTFTDILGMGLMLALATTLLM